MTLRNLLLTAAASTLMMAPAFAQEESDPASAQMDHTTLEAVLADPRRDDDRARDQYRHPKETLAFFGIEPGMTVIESLPSANGYYTKILLPYLGDDGAYYGLHYPERENFVEEFTSAMAEADWLPEGAAIDGAFLWDSIPADVAGQADVVFHARALHHMWRKGQAELAAQGSWDMLKPGGVVAVLQHRAGEDATDEQANGSKGYIKQSDVIATFEGAGFVFEEASEINANPKDERDYEIGVWRLPPRLAGDDEAQKEANRAIGESDRMTLKFRKPAE